MDGADQEVEDELAEVERQLAELKAEDDDDDDLGGWWWREGYGYGGGGFGVCWRRAADDYTCGEPGGGG